MQKFGQSQSTSPLDISDLIEVRVCDTCGDVGLERFLVVCSKCNDGAEHTYCMRVRLDKVPEGDWTCEECMPRPGTNKLVQDGVSRRQSAGTSSKLKLRSSSCEPRRHQDFSCKKFRTLEGELGNPSQSPNPGNYSLRTRARPVETSGNYSLRTRARPVETTGNYSLRSRAPSGKESPELGSQMEIAQQQECPPLSETKGQVVIADEKKGGSSVISGKSVATSSGAATALDGGLPFKDMAQIEAVTHVSPKFDYTWQGKFLIHKSEEGIERPCNGIQAHLSTRASLMAVQVADKLPEIIVLQELPREKTWPCQFTESQATEERSIALYFFAKDPHSYQTYYSRLVDYITENDLALKGIVDGVELLIFPSNVLPEKSQHWNGMLFLWGVFRGRREKKSANTGVTNGIDLDLSLGREAATPGDGVQPSTALTLAPPFQPDPIELHVARALIHLSRGG